MRSITAHITILLCSVLISCETTEPTPKVNPPGYQEQIKWPSLADSPWDTI